MCPCVHVSMCPCVNVSLSPCVTVSLFQCFSVSMSHCFPVSQFPRLHVSPFPHLAVSLPPCFPVSLSLSPSSLLPSSVFLEQVSRPVSLLGEFAPVVFNFRFFTSLNLGLVTCVYSLFRQLSLCILCLGSHIRFTCQKLFHVRDVCYVL